MTDSISLYTGHNLTVGSYQDPLLDKLVIAINHASIIEISVSFIMKSGLDLLFNALLDALNRGAELHLLTSDYLSVTQPVALRELMLLVDKGANVRVFQCEGNISFHLKSYILIKSHHNQIVQGCAWIGSNNMSKMALTQGHEWALRFDYEKPDNSKAALEFHHIRQQFEHLFTNHLTHSLSHKWIDTYNTRYKKQNPHFIRLITTETEPELDAFIPNNIQTEALLALEQTRLNGDEYGSSSNTSY